jgi:hypothetical protein
MRVGLSLSRCVRDIVTGKVNYDDVLVIVARTDFDPLDDKQWSGIWKGYGGGGQISSLWSAPEWSQFTDADEKLVRDTCIALQVDGKLHQPRKFGAYPSRLSYYWLETMAPSEDTESNPAIKKAWEQYKIVAGLTNNKQQLNDEF